MLHAEISTHQPLDRLCAIRRADGEHRCREDGDDRQERARLHSHAPPSVDSVPGRHHPSAWHINIEAPNQRATQAKGRGGTRTNES
jgi:hypothetical protein